MDNKKSQEVDDTQLMNEIWEEGAKEKAKLQGISFGEMQTKMGKQFAIVPPNNPEKWKSLIHFTGDLKDISESEKDNLRNLFTGVAMKLCRGQKVEFSQWNVLQ